MGRKRLRDEDWRNYQYDWTGPYISDGKWQASKVGFTTARNELEQSSKEHDIGLAIGKTKEDYYKADNEFYQANYGQGWKRTIAALAVRYGGPLFHPGEPAGSTLRGTVKKRPVSNLPGAEQPDPKRTRENPGGSEHGVREIAIDPEGNMSVPSTVTPTAPGPAAPAALAVGTGGVAGGTQGETPIMPYPSPALIQPDYVTLRHNWIGTVQYTSDLGALNRHEFRCNSPIDPNITNTTYNSPDNCRFNGFNEITHRYRYYRLLNNHITITFLRQGDPSTTNLEWLHNGPLIVGVQLNPSNKYPTMSSDIADWRQFAQARFSEWATMVGPNDRKKVFTIDYTPGKWDAKIDEEQKEKLWHRIDEHQGPDDRFTIFIDMINNSYRYNVQVIVTMHATIQYREWDESVTQRMFLLDGKRDTDNNEITVGSSAALGETEDLPDAEESSDP